MRVAWWEWAFIVVIPVLLGYVLFGCHQPPPNHAAQWGYYAATTYPVKASRLTNDGIRFDSQGQDISGALIDRLVGEVETCLARRIDRKSFQVLIPKDWTLSCDGTQQVLPTEGAGAMGCLAKGQTPTERCPCRWRAYIQAPNIIVATPSMYLLKDALTRFVTGSSNPWADPALAKCVQPTTKPLSSGAEP